MAVLWNPNQSDFGKLMQIWLTMSEVYQLRLVTWNLHCSWNCLHRPFSAADVGVAQLFHFLSGLSVSELSKAFSVRQENNTTVQPGEFHGELHSHNYKGKTTPNSPIQSLYDSKIV